MPVFMGSTATSATSTAYKLPARIKSFYIVNKTGGAAVINVSILYGSTNINIVEYNKSLSINTAYRVDLADILLLPGRQIYVLTNATVDYFFSITGGEQ